MLVLLPLKCVFYILFKNMETPTKCKFYVCHCGEGLTPESTKKQKENCSHVLPVQSDGLFIILRMAGMDGLSSRLEVSLE